MERSYEYFKSEHDNDNKNKSTIKVANQYPTGFGGKVTTLSLAVSNNLNFKPELTTNKTYN